MKKYFNQLSKEESEARFRVAYMDAVKEFNNHGEEKILSFVDENKRLTIASALRNFKKHPFESCPCVDDHKALASLSEEHILYIVLAPFRQSILDKLKSEPLEEELEEEEDPKTLRSPRINYEDV